MTSAFERDRGNILTRGPQVNPIMRTIMENENALRSAGIDTTAQTSAVGVNGYQDGWPELDLRPTSEPTLIDGKMVQSFAHTVRSRRGGLNLQRDYISKSHTRSAQSNLRSDFRDEEILSFKTETQSTVPSPLYSTIQPRFHWCNFQGRLVMMRVSHPVGQREFFVETSINDPTIKKVTAAFNDFGTISTIGVIKYSAGEYLLINTYIGFQPYWVLISNIDNPVSGAIYIPAEMNLAHVGLPNVAVGYQTGPFIQVGLPGNPIIVKSGTAAWLQPTQASPDWPGRIWEPATVTAIGWIGGYNFAIGMLAVQGRKPRAYFMQSANGYSFTISSVEANGLNYEEPELGITNVKGAAAVPGRGGMMITNGDGVVWWDGRERETGIFADEVAPAGQRFYVMGLYHDRGSVYASVAEFPDVDTPIPFADAGGLSIGRGRIRVSKRKYDFDLQRWFPISDWFTLTEDGLIRWDLYPNVPVPAVSTSQGKYGYSPLWGAPNLPFSSSTRQIVDYAHSAIKGGTTYDPAQGIYWTRQFEAPPGTNPYNFNSLKTYSASGKDRTSGMVWEGDALYADKFVQGVAFGGVDSGGNDSIVRIWISEYGHMDDVDSAGNRTAMSFEFKHGMSHEGRFIPARNNTNAIMVPQYEVEIVRGSANEKLTPQALPFTVYWQVVFPEKPALYSMQTGRANI